MKKILLSFILLLGLSLPAHAIVTSTINKNILPCNGSATTFQYTFPIIDIANATDLQISQFDNLGNQTILTTNYSVNTTTGTVTYPVSGTACPTGYTIVLLRVEPLTQGVAASYQGPGPTPPVMNMSDKLTMISQQLNEALTRALLLPITSTMGATFPGSAPGYLIGWNGSGVLANINNPAAVAQWSLSGANISYNTGNVSTTNTFTAGNLTSSGILNSNINWQDVNNLLASANVNWNDINAYALLNSGGVNWNNVNTISSINAGGVNWNNITGYATNAILQATTAGGVNWNSLYNLTPYIEVTNTQAQGTNGGSGTTGGWETTPLNTKNYDSASIASLCTGNGTPVATCTAAGQVVFPAGTYYVRAVSPFFGAVGPAQTRMYNVTASAVLNNLYGTDIGNNTSNATGLSDIAGYFTISTTSAITLQYQIGTHQGTTDLGANADYGTEVYAIVEFTKNK